MLLRSVAVVLASSLIPTSCNQNADIAKEQTVNACVKAVPFKFTN